MKQRKFHISGLFIVVFALLLVTCEKEKDEEVDPLVGIYEFGTSTLNDTVHMKVPLFGDITMMPGNSADILVEQGLLGAAPCDDSTNAAVELKSDGKIFYVCQNETNEAQMGTWLINTERTILQLNISNPQAFQLTISNLTITADAFSGTVENFPLPIDANFELGADLPTGGVNIQFKSIDLSFTKIP